MIYYSGDVRPRGLLFIYGRTFKTPCAVSVTLTFDLSRSNCFGELIMTPYVSRVLTFTNVVNEPIFKFGSQIDILANIDFGIASKYLHKWGRSVHIMVFNVARSLAADL